MNLALEKMKSADWNAVRAIYEEGIATGHATFETEVPEWRAWDRSHLRDCRLVAKAKEQVVGWTALSPVSERCVYAGVAEVSIYITSSARGQGIGKTLLKALIDKSEKVGIWTLQAGVFSENTASIALHKACGFREIGYRSRIGQTGDVWRDVVLLERRSEICGLG
jgi:L-amino acid N-acyltransferase YncA